MFTLIRSAKITADATVQTLHTSDAQLLFHINEEEDVINTNSAIFGGNQKLQHITLSGTQREV